MAGSCIKNATHAQHVAWISIARLLVVSLVLFGMAAEVEVFAEFPAGSSDRIAKLVQELESKRIRLEESDKWGLLPSLLKALEIPEESQCLVFSKTSFQPTKIGIDRPRAIYFNDDCYVGWVQDGRLIELAAVDADKGAVFYTLEAEPFEKPIIRRDGGQCLVCHDNHRTLSVPGFLVRSVYVSEKERFVRDSPAFATDHRSPFEQRWGGWYVTGSDGGMSHLGNRVSLNAAEGLEESERSSQVLALPESVVAGRYLASSGDIVALMVLEHQTRMQNLISRVRMVSSQLEEIKASTNDSERAEIPIIRERLARDCDELVRYLLTVDEFKLRSPVWGDSNFAETFSRRGPRDTLGRSLYELDLNTRLFRYPCSFLIYSAAFDAIPSEGKQTIGRLLKHALQTDSARKDDASLSELDRRAVAEILRDTKKDFWESYVGSD